MFDKRNLPKSEGVPFRWRLSRFICDQVYTECQRQRSPARLQSKVFQTFAATIRRYRRASVWRADSRGWCSKTELKSKKKKEKNSKNVWSTRKENWMRGRITSVKLAAFNKLSNQSGISFRIKTNKQMRPKRTKCPTPNAGWPTLEYRTRSNDVEPIHSDNFLRSSGDYGRVIRTFKFSQISLGRVGPPPESANIWLTWNNTLRRIVDAVLPRIPRSCLKY